MTPTTSGTSVINHVSTWNERSCAHELLFKQFKSIIADVFPLFFLLPTTLALYTPSLPHTHTHILFSLG